MPPRPQAFLYGQFLTPPSGCPCLTRGKLRQESGTWSQPGSGSWGRERRREAVVAAQGPSGGAQRAGEPAARHPPRTPVATKCLKASRGRWDLRAGEGQPADAGVAPPQEPEMGGGSGHVCTAHRAAPGPAAPPLCSEAPPLLGASLGSAPRECLPTPAPLPRRVSNQRLFPALFEERPTLQGPALCSGPQFPHLHAEGMSCSLRQREGRPGPLLLPVVESSGQAALLVGDSVSPTVPCGARLGLHPGPSLFSRGIPQGRASVNPSATQRRST